jgi:hypothetical protein
MQNNEPYRMYENDVDRLFGSKLENDRMNLAGTDWEGLRKKLDTHDAREKKPAYGKWVLGLLLLSGITGSAIYFSSSRKAASRNIAQQQIVTTKDNTHTIYSDRDRQQANTGNTGIANEGTSNTALALEKEKTNIPAESASPINTSFKPQIIKHRLQRTTFP